MRLDRDDLVEPKSDDMKPVSLAVVTIVGGFDSTNLICYTKAGCFIRVLSLIVYQLGF